MKATNESVPRCPEISSVVWLFLFIFLPASLTAQQHIYTVTITSDNAYMFGFGDENGVAPGSLYGGVRNISTGDIFSDLIWDVDAHGGALPPPPSIPPTPTYGPERYTIREDITGKYIYIVAWSDNRVYQGTVAVFQRSGSNKRYITGPNSAWEVYATGKDLNSGEDVYPTRAEINGHIALANNKTGLPPGSIGWVNINGCSDAAPGCRGTIHFCPDFTTRMFDEFTGLKPIFADANFMWYHNPDFPRGDCENAIESADSSGEYLIFRLGPLEEHVLGVCDSIRTQLRTDEIDGCCSHIALSNGKPDYWTGIRLRVLAGNARMDGVVGEVGWTVVPQGNPGSEVMLLPPAGTIPICSGEEYVRLCLDGTGERNASIEVIWIAVDSTLCRDTLRLNCRRPTVCEKLIVNGVLTSADSCTFDISVLNASGEHILGVDYRVTGGRVDGLSASGTCLLDNPASVIGPFSGSLRFEGLCSSSFTLSFNTTHDGGDDPVTIYLDILTDSVICYRRFSFHCDTTSTWLGACCDDVDVFSYIRGEEGLSERRFIVRNMLGDDNPISFIEIDAWPSRCEQSGGDAAAARVGGPLMPVEFSAPYERIPAEGSFASIGYAGEVQFRRAVPYDCIPIWLQGRCTVTVHHKYGDICTVEYSPWDAILARDADEDMVVAPIQERVYAGRCDLAPIMIAADCCEKSIAFILTDDTYRFLAGTGSWLSPDALNAEGRTVHHYMNDRETVFRRDLPLPTGIAWPSFRLFVASDPSVTSPPEVCWTTFDQDGNAVRQGCFHLSVTSVEAIGQRVDASIHPDVPELIHYYPNPSNQQVTITYKLEKDQNIQIALYSITGVLVRTVSSGWQSSGIHDAILDTRGLAAGNYVLRLSSGSGMRTRTIVIVR